MIVLHIIIIILLLCIWHDTMAVYDNLKSIGTAIMIIIKELDKGEHDEADN